MHFWYSGFPYYSVVGVYYMIHYAYSEGIHLCGWLSLILASFYKREFCRCNKSHTFFFGLFVETPAGAGIPGGPGRIHQGRAEKS